MTELAYLTDMPAAYVRTFEARVVALPPGGVVLDRTYFYPTGGGQPSDRGELRGGAGARFTVEEVQKSGPNVVHRLGRPSSGTKPLALGETVSGEIDWARRHRHMRLHTAQHLVSALVFARAGRRTRRASLAGDSATLDLDGGLPSRESVDAIAQEAEGIVASPRPVRVRTLPRAEWEREPAGRSGLVPLPPQVDPVRVIEIDGLDVCPCGGTHVQSTGEVGRLSIAPPVPLSGGAERLVLRLLGDDGSTPRG